MLAQMVGTEREAPRSLGTADKVAYAVGGALGGYLGNTFFFDADKVGEARRRLRRESPYDASSFGQGASDEKLRGGVRRKAR